MLRCQNKRSMILGINETANMTQPNPTINSKILFRRKCSQFDAIGHHESLRITYFVKVLDALLVFLA